MRYILTPIILLALWTAARFMAGPALVPSPVETMVRTFSLMTGTESLGHLSLTIFRGMTGLVLTYMVAIPAAILCGLSRRIMDIVSPLVTLSQSCPPVIWIALVMVWAGMGTALPVTVVVLTVFPPVFFGLAAGIRSIDPDLYLMARAYSVSSARVLRHIVIPGMRPALAGSLSYSLGVTWKVIATAEFFGSGDGIGSRLYWSFRFLDMTSLFAWALILMILGFLIETVLVKNIRDGAAGRRERTDAAL